MMNKLYGKIKHYLATHKKLSFILSHGGVHLALLLVLAVIIIVITVDVVMYSRREYAITDLEIKGLEGEKYRLDTLQITLSPKADEWLMEKYNLKVSGAFSPEDSMTIYNSEKVIETSGQLHFNYGSRAFATTEDKTVGDFEIFGISKGDTVGNRVVTRAWPSLTPIYAASSAFTGKTSGSPYHMFKIKINITGLTPSFGDESFIAVDLAGDGNRDNVIVFDHVYPQPTLTELNLVIWKGREGLESVMRAGEIFVDARDVRLAYEAERMNLLYNILLGTFIAFALDIIIQLIYKWRRLKTS